MRGIKLKSVLVILLGGAMLAGGQAVIAAGQPGETLFKQHCAACHPAGGNIINPEKSLNQKSREANKVKTADDIINAMRNPGPGMSRFDAKTIPDKEARQIADYIIITFK